MNTNRALTMIGVVVIGAGSLAGCGDDVETIAEADFVEQANARCQTLQDELDEVFETMWAGFEDADESDPAVQQQMYVAFDVALVTAAPAMHEMADDIRALGAPEGDEELLTDLLDDLDAAIDEFDATIDDALAGDAEARQLLDGDDAGQAMDDVNRRAREYGLGVCGAEE